MADRDMERRAFLDILARHSALGGIALLATSLLGCGGSDRAESDAEGRTGSEDAERGEAGASAGDPCGDLSALSDDELSDRRTVEYVPVTPDAEKRCDNCQLWIAPENGAPCGGCDILAGPIHPRGYCTAWSAV
ncbi:MAG: high-potential iron-sulfur protein [Candidatus Eisenbacteria bacterium]